jgi:hypothetical protein
MMDTPLHPLVLFLREIAIVIAIAILFPFITTGLTHIITPESNGTTFSVRSEYKFTGPPATTFFTHTETPKKREELRHLKSKEKMLAAQEAQLNAPAYQQLLMQTREKIEATEKEIARITNVQEQEKAKIKSQWALHNKTSLYVSGILGIAALLIGLEIPVISLGTGLILGGTASVLIGSLRSGYALNDLTGLALLLLALVLLVGLSLVAHKERSL